MDIQIYSGYMKLRKALVVFSSPLWGEEVLYVKHLKTYITSLSKEKGRGLKVLENLHHLTKPVWQVSSFLPLPGRERVG